MNGIIGMNAVLLSSTLTDEQRECAVAVRDSADALLRIINDLLDIAKLEAGRLDLENVAFDLVPMVEAAVGLLLPRAREKGLGLVIAIDDEGPGIPAADLERVFERFRRLEEPSDRALGDRNKGAGLGLSIAKGFVEAMNGRIAAASTLANGRGTRILISLPKTTPTHHLLL